LLDYTETIKHSRRTLLGDILRACDRALHDFQDALDETLAGLFEDDLPPNWREQLHACIVEQESLGYIVDPDSLEELEAWIEGWAKDCGLWPHERLRPLQTDADSFLLAAHYAPSKSRPAAAAPPARTKQEGFFNDDGIEIAGPGPEVTASFRAKALLALELLDPEVKRWWTTPSVDGKLRSRDAAFWQSGDYYIKDGAQRTVVVDQSYTAGQAAQAIIAASATLMAGSGGADYRQYRIALTLDQKEFQKWQKSAFKEAAQVASILAEMYVGSIAAIGPAGELVFTIGDLANNGPHWGQLQALIPYLHLLPVGMILLQLGKRGIRIPKKTAELLRQLSDSEYASLLREASRAPSDREAKAIIDTRVSFLSKVPKKPQKHHAISKIVHDALEEHPLLKGKYKHRDKRFEVMAIDYDAHVGWGQWHRDLDREVADWIKDHREATPAEFEQWLRQRYSEDDLRWRFTSGL